MPDREVRTLTAQELTTHVSMWTMADKLDTARSNLAAAYDAWFNPGAPFLYDDYWRPYFPASEETAFLQCLQDHNFRIRTEWADYQSDHQVETPIEPEPGPEPVGLLHGLVTPDLWCREVLLEGCSPCPKLFLVSSAMT